MKRLFRWGFFVCLFVLHLRLGLKKKKKKTDLICIENVSTESAIFSKKKRKQNPGGEFRLELAARGRDRFCCHILQVSFLYR